MKFLNVTREPTLFIIFSVLTCDCIGLVCIKLGRESPSVLVNPSPESRAISLSQPCRCTKKGAVGEKKCSDDELDEYKAFIRDIEKPFGISHCCVPAPTKEQVLMEMYLGTRTEEDEDTDIVRGSCETTKVHGNKQKTFYVIDKKTMTRSLCHCDLKKLDTVCARLPGRKPCDQDCISELRQLKHQLASVCCRTYTKSNTKKLN